jgi:hypothetical protein
MPFHPVLLVAFAAAAAGCAPLLPETQPERALVRDVSRVVDVRASAGWVVDEAELLQALPDAMKAACQVPELHRKRALTWLDDAIAERGGDVAAMWKVKDRDLDAVGDLLLLTRTRQLLGRADEWARTGRCPFWLEPAVGFAGVHTNAGRLFVTVEGGGRFLQEFFHGAVKYGGGGGGRLLVGYGFAETWALSTGLEFGGSARFTNLQLGEQNEFPDLVGLAAAPVVLRWQFGLTAHAEIEGGRIAYVDSAMADPTARQVDVQFDWGWRAGLAIGGSYIRFNRGVIPKFAVALTVDHVPSREGKPSLTQLGIGLRTGFELSRWTRFR